MAKRQRPRVWVPPLDDRLFTLDVYIVEGPISEEFAKKNKVISRTIQIRGNQTLADLHNAIFDAFDRFDHHLYEFQVGGKGPMDPKAKRYTPDEAMEDFMTGEKTAADAATTAIGSIGLKVDQVFGYWFDFGDDWRHKIVVVAIEEKAPPGKYPKLTGRVGKSPPQYLPCEDDEDDDGEDEDED
jgi:hypothetical protein